MRIHNLILSAAAAVSIGIPAAPALAQGEIVGGIVGGIIGGAIANSSRRTYTTTSSGYSAARAQNVQVQNALNYFGFPAGVADGVLGSRSRTAIASYQSYIGTVPTGTLNDLERNTLTMAHTRAQSGAPEAMKIMNAEGPKGLLTDQYALMTGGNTRSMGYAGMPGPVSDAIDEIADSSNPSAEQLLQRAGFIQLADLNGDGNNDYIIDTSFSGSSFWCNASQCRTLVFASTPGGYQRNDVLLANPTPASFSCTGGSCTVAATPAAPESNGLTTLASTAPALGTFGSSNSQDRLSSHCGRVSLITNANGGFTQIDSITDANLVLNEQFCVARTYAIEAGTRAAAAVGAAPEQIAQICSAYADAMSDIVSGASLKPRSAVVQEVGNFILTSGQNPAELTTTARICLGHGYQSDDMDVAISSTLLLVVLGEAPYGELMGHHLQQGIGAAKNASFAQEWYGESLAAIEAGAPSVFAPTMGDRPQLIRAALGAPIKTEEAPASTPVSLPTFEAAE